MHVKPTMRGSIGPILTATRARATRSKYLFLFVFALTLTTTLSFYELIPHAKAYAAAPANTAVTSYKEDNTHSGNHATETILNTSNVKQTTFGKRVSYPVDGQVYAQPLFLPNLSIGGAGHNVAFVATEHDSVYAFDADQTTATAPLWRTSFINPPAVVSPSNTDVSCNDMVPENGLSGTPVIDPATGTLYVVALTKEGNDLVYRLHALDVTTGNEKAGSPTVITATVAGTGAGSVNGQVTFNPKTERQRASPLLTNGKLYISWGSFCDNDPYHGWIMSYTYNGSSLQQVNVYNSTANATRGGLWAAGGAISADTAGNIYYVSGNGTFDLASGGVDAGDSFVKLNGNLQLQDYFTPFNQQCLDGEDADLGSGGPLLLPGQNRFIGAGKEGRIYVVDTTNMGKYNTIPDVCNNQGRTDVDKIVQELPPSTIGGLYSNATLWTNASGQQFVYFAGSNDNAKVFPLTNGKLSATPTSKTPESFGFTGGNPTVSSNQGAAGTGILWTLDPTPALRAYDATNLATELFASNQNTTRDGLDSYVKFSAPTVANGEVFVGTKTTLSIYGLLPTLPTPTPTLPLPSPTVTLSPTVTPSPTGTPLPGVQYNNIGISNDNSPAAANMDGWGSSYSAQALSAGGLTAGASAYDPTRTVIFTWPNVAAGALDNYQTNGQVLPVAPVANATLLGFLGSATNGPSSGTATITYTDGTTQTFTLGFSDWTLGGGNTTTLAYGNKIAYTTQYRNRANGQESVKTYIFYTSVNLQAGKTIRSVTLPTANQGLMHVFAVTTKVSATPIPLADVPYNNIGISDDASPASANMDTGGASYSTQALRAAGLNAGDNAFDPTRTVVFTWPNVSSGILDNYQTNGQILPVSPVPNASVLAFLGSATNGPSSGTAIITYTDGTTQTFTLGFSDWTLGGGKTTTLAYGNQISYTSQYRNTHNGKENVKTYVFYVSVGLQAGKTVYSVTLPPANQGQMHVFAVTTK